MPRARKGLSELPHGQVRKMYRDRSDPTLTMHLNRNLMARDEFKNLGFAEKPKEPEKGVKGELHW
jgi:hypothetical protein